MVVRELVDKKPAWLCCVSLGGGQGLNLVADKAGKTADFAGKIRQSVASGEAGNEGVGDQVVCAVHIRARVTPAASTPRCHSCCTT
jgi:hypothetical protein